MCTYKYTLSLTISTSDSPQKLNYSPSQQTYVLFWSVWVLVRTFKTAPKCNLTVSVKTLRSGQIAF